MPVNLTSKTLGIGSVAMRGGSMVLEKVIRLIVLWRFLGRHGQAATLLEIELQLRLRKTENVEVHTSLLVY